MVRKFLPKYRWNIKLTIDLHYIKSIHSIDAIVWLSSRVALVIAEIFREIYVIDTRSPVLSVALSDRGRKNEFRSTRFRTNEICVVWNNAVDAGELYLKCFIKKRFRPFLRPVGVGVERRESESDPESGFPNYATLIYEERHNLAASDAQDGCVSVPFNYGINHANGRPFRSAT